MAKRKYVAIVFYVLNISSLSCAELLLKKQTCCSTLIQDLNNSFIVLNDARATLTNPCAAETTNFVGTFTTLRDLRLTLTNCCAATINFNETFTTAEDLKITLTTHESVQKKIENETVSTKRKIKISNCITKDMTGYYYCWNTYYPSSFKLLINKEEFSIEDCNKKHEIQTEIEVENDKIDIGYSYNFTVKGICYRQGSFRAPYTIDPNTDEFDIKFSWQNADPNRVILEKKPNIVTAIKK